MHEVIYYVGEEAAAFFNKNDKPGKSTEATFKKMERKGLATSRTFDTWQERDAFIDGLRAAEVDYWDFQIVS